MINKAELDDILDSHKAQPVGNGYIDIIVKQENTRHLIEILISNDIPIILITWWEYVDAISKPSKHGYGGPKSNYYEGWFSEISFGDDEISNNTVESIMKIIEDKVFVFQNGEKVEYKRDEFLTPALWLDVPDEWKSSQELSISNSDQQSGYEP